MRLLDGGTATVVALRTLPGVGPMWDLSLDAVHTFAVGGAQAVVHNCPGGNSSAAQIGNQFHYDQLNGSTGQAGPSQLQTMYPNTEFDFAPRGVAGLDVKVRGGDMPWDTTAYPNTSWPANQPYADFKPDTSGGSRTLIRDIYSGKFPGGVVPIWYDPGGFVISWIGW